MSIQRLRTDFQFAVLVLFSLVALAGIGPFAVYRFVQGQWLVGAVDGAIVSVLAGTCVHVWRGGNVERAAMFLVGAMVLGSLVVGRLVGLSGALWSYPIIGASFLLVRRVRALVACIVLVALLVVDGSAFGSMLERLMYLSSAAVTCLLAYVFARQTEVQREQLEALASRDPLTGAANRRAMERELHIAAEAFRRHRVPAGVLVMDLDHFKRINDDFGHEAGDDVLVGFARLVQSRCRAGDRLFRYGGEEFVLLLPGTDDATLATVAEELRAAVAGRIRTGDGRAVTVSIGAAALQTGEDPSQWLARADAAMYSAKRAGRDRVMLAG
ncbi:GGDEF domain-containing protein [Lysobacter xanthus]